MLVSEVEDGEGIHHAPATEYHVTGRVATNNRKRQQKFRTSEQLGLNLPDIIVDDTEMEPLNVNADTGHEQIETRFVEEVDGLACFHNSVERSPKNKRSTKPKSKRRSLDITALTSQPTVNIQEDNIMWL